MRCHPHSSWTLAGPVVLTATLAVVAGRMEGAGVDPVAAFTPVTVAEVRNGGDDPGAMNTFLAVGDVDGDGLPDIVVSGRAGRMVWLRNAGRRDGYELRRVADVECMECGGCLHDLTGDGRLDIVCGGDWRSDELWWWENPGPTGGPWRRRVVVKTGYPQFHDTLIATVGGDRTPSLLFTNQLGEGGARIGRVPLPADPTTEPWPGVEIIGQGKTEPFVDDAGDARSQPEEGLAVGDVDGDGLNEIVAGTHWYRRSHEGVWESHQFARGYITTKVAVGDLNGDGRQEIVLSEGDPCIYGKGRGGKLSWFARPEDPTMPWEEHVLADGLLDAHSLALADLSGSGRLDVLCGEIGVAGPDDGYVGRPPRLMVFENLGGGKFAGHVIAEGIGAHDAVLADMLGRGKLDIVSRPLHGPRKWEVHVYFHE